MHLQSHSPSPRLSDDQGPGHAHLHPSHWSNLVNHPVCCVQMSGTFKVGADGSVELKEDDGIDYAPVTVQLPGGERVAFLFTVKSLDAKGTLDSFSGDFVVPSYRGSSFLDPKVGFVTVVSHGCTSLPVRIRMGLVEELGVRD